MNGQISQETARGLLVALKDYVRSDIMALGNGYGVGGESYDNARAVIDAAEAELAAPEPQPATLDQAGNGQNHTVGL